MKRLLTFIIIGVCVWPLGYQRVEKQVWAESSDAHAQQAQASIQDSANDLFVSVGKSVLVDTAHPVARIVVGLGDVAEATVVSRSEIIVNGKTAGETSLIVWEAEGGRQFFNVKVRPSAYNSNDRLEGIRREMRSEFPGQNIKISTENGSIFLRGTVKDLTSSERAVQIASTAGKVVNLLYVDVPPAEPQILLKVRFASVDRSTGIQAGLNVFSLGATNSIGTVSTQQFSPPGIDSSDGKYKATLTDFMNLFIFRPDLNLGATLKALETKGVLQLLAEPNLLVENGKQGSFLAGGQYPYPTVQGVTGTGAGAITIAFKEFGVRLNFIPTVTPRNTVRLQVAPEVSSLDFANGLNISGFTIPSLDVRKVKTEVELAEGQSFAIGGLLDNRETQNFSKIPFIGDIPILGKLFQSTSKTRQNTELIVIVTPEIVAPAPANAKLPELNYPEKFMAPNTAAPLRTPGADVTGAKPLGAAAASIPVEKLVQSMQPEQPLAIDSTTSGTMYSAPSGGVTTASPPAPTPQ